MRKGRDIRQSVLGLYSLILFTALAGTGIAYGLVRAALPLLDLEVLAPSLNGVFAMLYASILAGLIVCALLLAWLRLRAIGIVLSVLVVGLWLLGLRRHVPSPSVLLYGLPLVIGGVLFSLSIRYASRHMFPIFHRSEASKAFDILRKHLWAARRPRYILDDAAGENASTLSAGDLSSHQRKTRPSVVLTSCDQAIAVSDKVRLKGVRDPGLNFLEPEERVAQVINLRPQVRTFSLIGRTQDGIQIRVRASVAFRIDAGRRRPKLGEPLPFSRAAVFKALRAQTVERERGDRLRSDLAPRLWYDLPPIRGEHLLRDIISRLDFDDLYGPHQLDGEAPRRRIARTLKTRLQAVLGPMGIQLLDVDLGNLQPVDSQVYLRRARNWQTEWIRRVTLTQAEGQVERLQILERARADARAELILDLGRQIERLAESKAEVGPDTVLDRFLVVVDSLMSRPQLTNVLPERTKEVLSDVREAIGE